MVALQGHVTAVRLRKIRHGGEFAGSHPRLKVIATKHILEIFHPVDLVDALLGGDDQTDVVPFADGLGGVENFAGLFVHGRLIERIQPAATLRIGGFALLSSSWNSGPVAQQAGPASVT